MAISAETAAALRSRAAEAQTRLDALEAERKQLMITRSNEKRLAFLNKAIITVRSGIRTDLNKAAGYDPNAGKRFRRAQARQQAKNIRSQMPVSKDTSKSNVIRGDLRPPSGTVVKGRPQKQIAGAERNRISTGLRDNLIRPPTQPKPTRGEVLAVTRSVEGGGSITVARTGLTTYRGSRGGVITKTFSTPESSLAFRTTQSKNINQEVESRRFERKSFEQTTPVFSSPSGVTQKKQSIENLRLDLSDNRKPTQYEFSNRGIERLGFQIKSDYLSGGKSGVRTLPAGTNEAGEQLVTISLKKRDSSGDVQYKKGKGYLSVKPIKETFTLPVSIAEKRLEADDFGLYDYEYNKNKNKFVATNIKGKYGVGEGRTKPLPFANKLTKIEFKLAAGREAQRGVRQVYKGDKFAVGSSYAAGVVIGAAQVFTSPEVAVSPALGGFGSTAATKGGATDTLIMRGSSVTPKSTTRKVVGKLGGALFPRDPLDYKFKTDIAKTILFKDERKAFTEEFKRSPGAVVGEYGSMLLTFAPRGSGGVESVRTGRNVGRPESIRVSEFNIGKGAPRRSAEVFVGERGFRFTQKTQKDVGFTSSELRFTNKAETFGFRLKSSKVEKTKGGIKRVKPEFVDTKRTTRKKANFESEIVTDYGILKERKTSRKRETSLKEIRKSEVDIFNKKGAVESYKGKSLPTTPRSSFDIDLYKGRERKMPIVPIKPTPVVPSPDKFIIESDPIIGKEIIEREKPQPPRKKDKRKPTEDKIIDRIKDPIKPFIDVPIPPVTLFPNRKTQPAGGGGGLNFRFPKAPLRRRVAVTSTLRSSFFGIEGDITQGSIITGLGTRGLAPSRRKASKKRKSLRKKKRSSKKFNSGLGQSFTGGVKPIKLNTGGKKGKKKSKKKRGKRVNGRGLFTISL